MMHTQFQQPVHSEYRQYQSPFLRQWFQPYILKNMLQQHHNNITEDHLFSTQTDRI